jgi:rhomboid family GlyGly-CTERM serine protease
MITKEPAVPVTTASSRQPVIKSLNCDGLHGLALAAALAALLLPLAGGGELAGLWRYERAGIAAGQWWRLLTAHVVHLDSRHALLNAAGFALLWALFARSYRPAQWGLAAAAILLVIDGGFWFVSPGLQWYMGASALLHGCFACGVVAMIRQREALGWVAAGALLVKIAWEQWQGPLPLTPGPVVTDSHLYGAIGGLLAGLLLRPQRQPLY